MLITAPVIGRLLLRPRLRAYRHVKAGAFGLVVHRRGRVLEVDVANVEACLGRHFTAEQLAAAGLHLSAEPEEAR
jgi:hypothetical protein